MATKNLSEYNIENVPDASNMISALWYQSGTLR